ncbi:MAG: DNA methyltransferase [Chloroflexi bacterium]|nr:DNA methyltransferase [Chloroflexota bacterium]
MSHRRRSNSAIQQLEDVAVHGWYRFVLSYPDHLVSQMINEFGIRREHTVLDPFVGTGTTLVECKKSGISSVGIDANPVSAFASRVKTTWDIDLAEFDRRRHQLLESIREPIRSIGAQYSYQLSFDDLLLPGMILCDRSVDDDESLRLLFPKNWLSEVPFRKTLIIKRAIDALPDDAITDVFRLALAAVVVTDVSNVGFGPEVYVARKREDADAYRAYAEKLRRVRHDLAKVQQIPNAGMTAVYCGDARRLTTLIEGPIDYVITSPPYPNEKDYTRITRLELILLGFIGEKGDLRRVKKEMLRSHTRNVYVADDDSVYVADIPEIQEVAQEVERRRVERGATSGFERLYHRVVTEYFGGMCRVLEQLQQVMSPGGKLALVVGDQMSYFRVPIRTARLLSLVACRKLHYAEVETIVWRTRRATATNMDIEEHILILERQ